VANAQVPSNGGRTLAAAGAEAGDLVAVAVWLEVELPANDLLQALYLTIVEFEDRTAGDADQVVMMGVALDVMGPLVMDTTGEYFPPHQAATHQEVQGTVNGRAGNPDPIGAKTNQKVIRLKMPFDPEYFLEDDRPLRCHTQALTPQQSPELSIFFPGGGNLQRNCQRRMHLGFQGHDRNPGIVLIKIASQLQYQGIAQIQACQGRK